MLIAEEYNKYVGRFFLYYFSKPLWQFQSFHSNICRRNNYTNMTDVLSLYWFVLVSVTRFHSLTRCETSRNLFDLYYLFIVFNFWGWVLLNCPGWPVICYIVQSGFRLGIIFLPLLLSSGIVDVCNQAQEN